MRNLDEVIADMLPFVPEELRQRLSHVLENIPYTPPEALDMRWLEVQQHLNAFLPESIDELNDWQKKMLKVWTGKDF